MAPSSQQAALLAMMDDLLHSHVQCNCSACKKLGSKTRSPSSKDSTPDANREIPEVLASLPTKASSAEKYCCHEHSHNRPPPGKKIQQSPATLAHLPRATLDPAALQNRNDKINALLKAETVQAVFDVFKSIPTTNEETELAQHFQTATTDCKTFPEAKNQILRICNEDEVDIDACWGLLAKYRHERNLLTSTVIRSNLEREKHLAVIHRVDHLIHKLQKFAKDRKDLEGKEVRESLGSAIMELHELAQEPSLLYEEMMDLREENVELMNEQEDQQNRYFDMESCHERLHEKNKKLSEEHNSLKTEYAESRKKAGMAGNLQTSITRLQRLVEKGNDDNKNLQKEIERLHAESGKINALKHENAQLKKKIFTLATQDAVKEESKAEAQPPDTSHATKKNKKGKKASAPADTSNTDESVVEELHARLALADKDLERERADARTAREKASRDLETVRASVQHLEELLRKSEVTEMTVAEKLEVEQATAQNWKELSEGRSEENTRLRHQLDQSTKETSALQSSVYRLERSLTETKEQIRTQSMKRTLSPSADSQASTVISSSPDTTSLRALQKAQSSMAQLARDLDESRSHPVDPWGVVACTSKLLNEIERDITEAIRPHPNDDHEKLGSALHHPPETYLPFSTNPVNGLIAPVSSRQADSSPRISQSRMPVAPASMPPFRPMVPPGLASHGPSPVSATAMPLMSSSTPPASFSAQTHSQMHPPTHPQPHPPSSLPAAIGTGRPTPGRTQVQMTPSPKITASLHTTASTGTSTGASTVGLVNGNRIGNGAAGVDWSMWTKR